MKAECTNFHGHACAVNDEDALIETFGNIGGKIDGLVNNAGIAHCEPFLNFDLKKYDEVMDINTRAVFHCTQLAARAMIDNNIKGSIVNLSSQASVSALPDHVAYCMSKAAVDMLTNMAALELGGKGIRVNSVNPTVVMTKMGREVWDAERGRPMLNRIPAGRFCEEEEVCNAIMFYLSDEAAFCSGSRLMLDGGMTNSNTLK